MEINSSHKRQTDNAEQNFHKRLAELGATLLEPKWLGSRNPHHVRCVNGHDCYPRPTNTIRSDVCVLCANYGSFQAEANFRIRLSELGATLLEPKWLGNRIKHHVRCVDNHDCYPRPNQVQQGKGICKACAGNDSANAYAYFQMRLMQLGATLIESEWMGSVTPHHVRCASDHDCYPRPNQITSGKGICHKCAHMLWNTFYVVVGRVAGNIKFGITSDRPESRLRDHAREGYTYVVRLMINLPDGMAKAMEDACITELRERGFTPIRGREYFDVSALPHVLSVADSYRKLFFPETSRGLSYSAFIARARSRPIRAR
jgi:hypothetical protein